MMAVTEPQRLALHAAARTALGDAQGDTLMALVPPANTDIATIQALDRLEERVLAKVAAGSTALAADMTARIHRSQLWTIGILVTLTVALHTASVGVLLSLLR
jgi:hypothetical protein